MNPHGCRRGRWLPLFVCVGAAVLLTGCQTTVQSVVKRSLTPEEVQAIQAGKKSVVLFRLTATEGRDQESLDHIMDLRWNLWNVNDWQNRRILAEPEDAAPSLSWRVPSEALGKAGWRYLVLDPGRYFIKVKPDVGRADGFPVYHVSIPPGPGPVYAGSFHFAPTNPIARLFQGRLKTYPGFAFAGVLDESDAAREAGTHLPPSLGRILTSLAVPNDLAAALQPFSGRKILAVEATNRPPQATKYVGRKAAAIMAAPLALSGAVLLAAASADANDDEDSYGDDANDHTEGLTGRAVLAGCGVVLIIAAVPVALLGNATVGSIVRMNWSPHEAALKQKITEFNLARQLTNSLLTALADTNAPGLTETNAGAGLVVHVDVTASAWNLRVLQDGTILSKSRYTCP